MPTVCVSAVLTDGVEVIVGVLLGVSVAVGLGSGVSVGAAACVCATCSITVAATSVRRGFKSKAVAVGSGVDLEQAASAARHSKPRIPPMIFDLVAILLFSILAGEGYPRTAVATEFDSALAEWNCQGQFEVIKTNRCETGEDLNNLHARALSCVAFHSWDAF